MVDNAKDNPVRILVFSTEKISDPAIDLAGLLKIHYPATVYTLYIPCSSAVKSRWILHALENGADGVFIAADGTDCVYGESCTELTSKVVARTHQQMKQKGIEPSRLKMAAICSVCAEPFARHMKKFVQELSEK